MRCACYRGRLSAPAISRRRPRQGRRRDQVPLRSICPPVWTVRCAVLKRSTSMFSAQYCVEQGHRRLQTCCKVPVRLQLWHQKHSEISTVDKQRQHRRWFCSTIGGHYYNHTCFRCENERVRRVKAEVADVHDVWPNVTCPNATTVVNESLLSSSLGHESGLLTPQCMMGHAAVSLINDNTVNKHLWNSNFATFTEQICGAETNSNPSIPSLWHWHFCTFSHHNPLRWYSGCSAQFLFFNLMFGN